MEVQKEALKTYSHAISNVLKNNGKVIVLMVRKKKRGKKKKKKKRKKKKGFQLLQ